MHYSYFRRRTIGVRCVLFVSRAPECSLFYRLTVVCYIQGRRRFWNDRIVQEILSVINYPIPFRVYVCIIHNNIFICIAEQCVYRPVYGKIAQTVTLCRSEYQKTKVYFYFQPQKTRQDDSRV